jgi:N-acetyltransferase
MPAGTCDDLPVGESRSVSQDAWYERPTLTGRHVLLRPLQQSDADAWIDALGEPASAAELWRGMTVPRPKTDADAQQVVADHLARQEAKQSVCFTQIDAATGRLAGLTTYYDINPPQRALAIGWTWIARPYWSTGINAESKLMLLERAFDVLGAVRVVWHVDIRNERSQAAVSKLGAVREGVLRKHKLRPDGSWRDTVLFAITDDEWPVHRDRLRDRVAGRS